MTRYALRLKWLGIDTYQEAVIFMRRDCTVCRAEGVEAQSRVQVMRNGTTIVATVNVMDSDLLAPSEASLSRSAWRQLGGAEGAEITITLMPPLESLEAVRAKIYGHRLNREKLHAIVSDVAAGRYADIHLAAFVTTCAGGRLDIEETVELTRAMVDVGERLRWARAPIADKHCIGGLPGNRTTPIVVAIIAAAGLTMPKTSSRAITSPAGTADTMEVLAPVDLDVAAIRRVVEREGGCIVWGGGVGLSPADDILIRVERPLDIDGEAQMVASVISKKVAAGSTHVVIDVPVGATAKVRSAQAAALLKTLLEHVAAVFSLQVQVLFSDGDQPVGRGIGPALDARDVVAVLRNEADAPADLREHALLLAGTLLEFCGSAPEAAGGDLARSILASGAAWTKFVAICDAQGGLREPPRAAHRREVTALFSGRVQAIDNRQLARAAKLAGAPHAHAAGLDLHVRLGERVERGAPLFTLHAEAQGELDYAYDYVATHPRIFTVQSE
jgi:thymidine phosphorylase